MKKTIINAFVLFVFWVFLYAVTVFIAVRVVTLNPINGIKPFFFTLFLFSLLYGRWWNFAGFRKWSSLIKYLLVFFLSFGSIYYTYSIVLRSVGFYHELTAAKYSGWVGKPQRDDDTMGLVHVKNARGYHVYPVGENVPITYNAQGFRVAPSDTAFVAHKDSLDVLFLGCSWTFGDACFAEQTYPFLVGEMGSMRIANAGVCSYGLSQMYLLSGKLIPQLKPRYTVVQFSPWLVERGTSIGAPAPTFLPVPYFYDTRDTIDLQYPVQKTQVFEINREEIRQKYTNRKTSFVLGYGIPFFIREDLKYLRYLLPVWLGGPPAPSEDRRKVERLVYREIIKKIKREGSIPVVVCMGDRKYSQTARQVIGDPAAIIVNADEVLWAKLDTKNPDGYSRRYQHWRKQNPGDKDSVLIDGHPNPLAHRIIANEILKKIKK